MWTVQECIDHFSVENEAKAKQNCAAKPTARKEHKRDAVGSTTLPQMRSENHCRSRDDERDRHKDEGSRLPFWRPGAKQNGETSTRHRGLMETGLDEWQQSGGVTHPSVGAIQPTLPETLASCRERSSNC